MTWCMILRMKIDRYTWMNLGSFLMQVLYVGAPIIGIALGLLLVRACH